MHGCVNAGYHVNRAPEFEGVDTSNECFRQVDLRMDELWKQGDWKTFSQINALISV